MLSNLGIIERQTTQSNTIVRKQYLSKLRDRDRHTNSMHIAVIGAGTAGLCAAKHAIANGFDVTVLEQAAQVGGTWVYTDTVGKDQFGLDVHTSMYQGLQ